MKPKELADMKLGQYKRKNSEINAKHCPFCGPNSKSDNQYKFYMNAENGAFKCYREKKCGRTGSFYDLLEYFGLEGEFEFENDDIDYQQSYTKPEVETEEPSGPVEEYLDLRCIDKEVWQKHNVKEKDGNIAFEYYQNSEKVLIKYRTASKKKGYWQEPGGKPVLWEIDKVDPEEPLVITEGELDKLAIHQAGYDNVVSVPFGTNNLKWIKHCWDTLEEVEGFIIWADNDEAGAEMEDEVIKRLGKHRCRIVDVKCNDANLLLYKEGEQAVLNAIENAKQIPIAEIKQLDEIEQFDPQQIPKVKSRIPLINKYFGGYLEGMVTIWTGTNGSGKSTFLNGEVLECVDQGKPITVVSGELPNSMLRYWLELQAAGPKNVQSKFDDIREERTYYVAKEDKKKIRKWAKDKLLVYDSFSSLEPDNILDVFEATRKRYNCRNFVVDNLMVLEYSGGYRDKYSKQANFIKRAKNFAQKYDSHIHIVAHPRKNEGVISKEDIAGLYEVSNLVDNVAGIVRVNEKTKPNLPEELHEADNILMILKSRLYGEENKLIQLMFNNESKRFFQRGDNEARNKKYGWEGVKLE